MARDNDYSQALRDYWASQGNPDLATQEDRRPAWLREEAAKQGFDKPVAYDRNPPGVPDVEARSRDNRAAQIESARQTGRETGAIGPDVSSLPWNRKEPAPGSVGAAGASLSNPENIWAAKEQDYRDQQARKAGYNPGQAQVIAREPAPVMVMAENRYAGVDGQGRPILMQSGPMSRGELEAQRNPPAQAPLPSWSENWGPVPQTGWAQSPDNQYKDYNQGPMDPEDPRYKAIDKSWTASEAGMDAGNAGSTDFKKAGISAAGSAIWNMNKSKGGNLMGGGNPMPHTDFSNAPPAMQDYSTPEYHSAAEEYWKSQAPNMGQIIWNSKIGK
jgi:hypothetical protein